MAIKHTRTHTVTVTETELLGNIANYRIFEWYSNSRVDFYIIAGLIEIVSGKPQFIGTDGAVVLLRRYEEADFFKTLSFGDEVAISSEVVSVGEHSIKFEHEVRRGEELIARAYSLHVYVDPQFGKKPIPETIKSKLFEGN